jgi:hypothetical protein
MGHVHQQPCWQQAGISQSAMQQRKQIEQSTRSQVEAVCLDSSLTPQQRREKNRQIRQQAHQQMQALISPEQQQALSACRAQRGGGHSMGGGIHTGGGTGPCGDLPLGKSMEPPPESEPEQ